MSYFAETDANGVVIRVVVADSAAWCVEHLGGTWVETADPYAPPDRRGAVAYCGPGYGYDPTAPERFAPAYPSADDAPEGSRVFVNGRIVTGRRPPEGSDLQRRGTIEP